MSYLRIDTNHSGMVFLAVWICGCSSAVESQLPKLVVAGSNPVARSSDILQYLKTFPSSPSFPVTRISVSMKCFTVQILVSKCLVILVVVKEDGQIGRAHV